MTPEITRLEKKIDRLEKGQYQLKVLLQKALGNLAQSREWGTWEDACKILHRSKSWYKEARNGEGYEKGSKVKVFLTEGVDWRKVGGSVEYYLPSIERLKERITKKAPLVH